MGTWRVRRTNHFTQVHLPLGGQNVTGFIEGPSAASHAGVRSQCCLLGRTPRKEEWGAQSNTCRPRSPWSRQTFFKSWHTHPCCRAATRAEADLDLGCSCWGLPPLPLHPVPDTAHWLGKPVGTARKRVELSEGSEGRAACRVIAGGVGDVQLSAVGFGS